MALHARAGIDLSCGAYVVSAKFRIKFIRRLEPNIIGQPKRADATFLTFVACCVD